jgi:uncharacterized protein
MIMTLKEKKNRLNEILTLTDSAVIAHSGGTDSSFLVSVAAKISSLRLLAVTVNTPYMFRSEIREADDFCSKLGVNHKEITFAIPDIVINNPSNRCYLCKTVVIKAIRAAAAEAGITTVFDGTNADDVNDFRPGMKALQELGVRSPLLEAGLTKEEIRTLAREARLDISEKLSNSCLMTRFPHDTIIRPEDLRKAEDAERILTQLGLPASRIRIHGEIARIECRKEHIEKIISKDVREKVIYGLKALGYRYITLDLEGYRSGSMNKTT